MTAVQQKDKTKLAELAADDFALRRASDPATPEPRDAWIANELPTYELKDFRFTKMAVRISVIYIAFKHFVFHSFV